MQSGNICIDEFLRLLDRLIHAYFELIAGFGMRLEVLDKRCRKFSSAKRRDPLNLFEAGDR